MNFIRKICLFLKKRRVFCRKSTMRRFRFKVRPRPRGMKGITSCIRRQRLLRRIVRRILITTVTIPLQIKFMIKIDPTHKFPKTKELPSPNHHFTVTYENKPSNSAYHRFPTTNPAKYPVNTAPTSYQPNPDSNKPHLNLSQSRNPLAPSTSSIRQKVSKLNGYSSNPL